MKRLIALASLGLALTVVTSAQQLHLSPDCYSPFTASASGRVLVLDNRAAGCTTWTVVYSATGAGTTSVELDEAGDNAGLPAVWTLWPAGSLLNGSVQPLTSTSEAQATATGFYPWVSVNVTVSGGGKITGALMGTRPAAFPGGSPMASTVNQGSSASAANSWPVRVSDGTNLVGTGPSGGFGLNVAVAGADNGNNPAYLRIDGWGDGLATSYKGALTFANLMAFNGSSFDRLRSASAAAGTGGVGVLAAGCMDFDGSNYHACKALSDGTLIVAPHTQSTTFPALSALGSTASFATQGSSNHSVVALSTGAPTSCTVQLDGSLDGSNWFNVSGSQSCTSSLIFHVTGVPLLYVRGTLTALSGGTSPAITLTYLGTN